LRKRLPRGELAPHPAQLASWKKNEVLEKPSMSCIPNTMSADFYVEALEEALTKFGPPETFNTGEGSQFTGEDFTTPLKAAGRR
jgi:hypothetical protein